MKLIRDGGIPAITQTHPNTTSMNQNDCEHGCKFSGFTKLMHYAFWQLEENQDIPYVTEKTLLPWKIMGKTLGKYVYGVPSPEGRVIGEHKSPGPAQQRFAYMAKFAYEELLSTQLHERPSPRPRFKIGDAVISDGDTGLISDIKTITHTVRRTFMHGHKIEFIQLEMTSNNHPLYPHRPLLLPEAVSAVHPHEVSERWHEIPKPKYDNDWVSCGSMWCLLLATTWRSIHKPRDRLKSTLTQMGVALSESLDIHVNNLVDNAKACPSIPGMETPPLGAFLEWLKTSLRETRIDFVEMMRKADVKIEEDKLAKKMAKTQEKHKVLKEFSEPCERENEKMVELARIQKTLTTITPFHKSYQKKTEKVALLTVQTKHFQLKRTEEMGKIECELLKMMLPCVNKKFNSIFHNFQWPNLTIECVPCGKCTKVRGICNHNIVSLPHSISYDAFIQIVVYLSL